MLAYRIALLLMIAPFAMGVHCHAQVASRSPSESGAGIWMNDLNKAVDLAREKQKPLLVLFRCEP